MDLLNVEGDARVSLDFIFETHEGINIYDKGFISDSGRRLLLGDEFLQNKKEQRVRIPSPEIDGRLRADLRATIEGGVEVPCFFISNNKSANPPERGNNLQINDFRGNLLLESKNMNWKKIP